MRATHARIVVCQYCIEAVFIPNIYDKGDQEVQRDENNLLNHVSAGAMALSTTNKEICDALQYHYF